MEFSKDMHFMVLTNKSAEKKFEIKFGINFTKEFENKIKAIFPISFSNDVSFKV